MKDKDILNMLGLNDRTITLTADDEYLQIMLEKKIDNYLKKLDEEKKKFLAEQQHGGNAFFFERPDLYFCFFRHTGAEKLGELFGKTAFFAAYCKYERFFEIGKMSGSGSVHVGAYQSVSQVF